MHPVKKLNGGVSFWSCTFLLLIIFRRFLEESASASELIGLHQPITALVGDNVLLPCHINPAVNVDHETVIWTKYGLDPMCVHFHKDGQLWFEKQNPSYYLRTRLFMDELLRGNISMQIFEVEISDAGKYFCSLPSMQQEASIQLIVGAVSNPTMEVVSNTSGHVVLQCDSTGWYPEPEVFWLDGEANLLSAGPPETVRGPDDLYTVSSRVTVEKRHSNSFTCRVTQKKTNQTREATIQVPVDVFTVRSFPHWIWSIIMFLVSAIWIFIIIVLKKKCIEGKIVDVEKSQSKRMMCRERQLQNVYHTFYFEGQHQPHFVPSQPSRQ